MKKSAGEIREQIKEKITVCNIVLWGYGSTAKNFFEKYKKVFKIKGCVTDERCHPKFFDDEHTIPIIEWNDYDGTNDYIVVCDTPFPHIENEIMASGLHLFEDYIDIQILEAILINKKIAIVAGNCQLAMIFDFLKECKSFTEQYQLFRFTSHYWKTRWSLKTISFFKNLCELYICINHEEKDKKFFKREELPENCKIVTVPTTTFRLYWPQFKVDWRTAKNEYFILSKEAKGHSPFKYADSNINRMIAEGKEVEEIVELLIGDDFYTKEEIDKHVEMTLRVAEYREGDCDIKIASYVKENYQKRMLFRDMTHMQTDLVWEMVMRIMEYLGMDTTEITEMREDENNPVNQIHINHCTETPVYPSVAKHLGLEWCDRDTLFIVTAYNGVRKMTFEEYIRLYYSVCSKIKQIKEEW